ncbi:molybdopterin molybdotransferase MoeA [Aphanothece sacrum]|uniref:Molybdopterin molybdenumtransferase n=1 Tax=Aphanothece sacrum FPU1 TaxID=1920663 RepID=A0A401IBW9_APHSA|nr:gephyrin-like molybdotransferase Glp [Aphanothece sacrum]GBF78720.1 molybdenum cofactor synthesis domain protein [Aphanothece sacrum FPU1]GBF86951.1 molybdenum cofactor synthesis domain protein [Aphanothece sacrum FPU3]
MFSVQQAQSIILDSVQPLKTTETVTLNESVGRILAELVTSNLDFPYWDNSAMDGYGVKFDDVVNCSPENPITLKIIEEIPAGVKPKKIVQSGQACRIFTGAMLPSGADTIIIQENTQKIDDKVLILLPPKFPKAFVRHQGDFYQAGHALLTPGIRINASEIAVLATAQCPQVKVYCRPRVAIFSTGNELILPSESLQPGQIVDSNQYALGAFVQRQGAISIQLGIVSDNIERLEEKISLAINSADFVLSTGGVSVGEYDYIEQILSELGGEILIRSIAIQPGKPLTVAKFSNGCIYFGIPGNPVSALVSCWRFVQPALKKLSGLKKSWKPNFIKAKSCQLLESKGQRETYIWGQLKLVDGEYEFELAGGSQNSANLINLAMTNALAILPVGTTMINAGESVLTMLIDC